MDDSPFRRIVLPALLASSAGFAALTWPLASNYSEGISRQLPPPLNHWGDPALITSQDKELSIRYIGFAILSSVAIGVGTAGAMRKRETRMQRHHQLLQEVMTALEEGPALASEGDRSPAPAVHSAGTLASGAIASSECADSVAVAPEPPTLDWTELVRPVASDEPALAAAVLSTPMDAHQIYQIREVNQHHCLALKIGDEYYRFYRQRPSLDRAQILVQQLQRRGQGAIATRDGSGYVVWIHQPDPINPIAPWPVKTAGGSLC